MISFIMDWLDLLAVQGTLKSLLQHAGGFFTTEPWGKPQQILKPISFSFFAFSLLGGKWKKVKEERKWKKSFGQSWRKGEGERQ